MICEHCQSEFELNGKRGGQNRTFCFKCVPEGLSKPERARVHQDLRKERSHALKLEMGCSVCGYNKCASALEWHHKEDDKIHDPSNAIKRSWESYLSEIKSCVLLCANCHRETHEGIISV